MKKHLVILVLEKNLLFADSFSDLLNKSTYKVIAYSNYVNGY